MTIVNVDGKALEWVTGSILSGDKVAWQEIMDMVDQHTLNQDAFGLPSRLIAKKFIFRLIFGGTAYTYAHDPDFTEVSSSEKYWQRVIDKFNDKYKGWNLWWGKLLQEATTTGKITNPYTGRTYLYEAKPNFRGDLVWPETTIKNYIVQGFAADLMSIARISFMRRFKEAKIPGLIVNTVHDSIVVDVPEEYVQQTVDMLYDVFDDIPKNFEHLFKKTLSLPIRCEVSVGKNMKELTEVKRSGTI